MQNLLFLNFLITRAVKICLRKVNKNMKQLFSTRKLSASGALLATLACISTSLNSLHHAFYPCMLIRNTVNHLSCASVAPTCCCCILSPSSGTHLLSWHNVCQSGAVQILHQHSSISLRQQWKQLQPSACLHSSLFPQHWFREPKSRVNFCDITSTAKQEDLTMFHLLWNTYEKKKCMSFAVQSCFNALFDQ